MGAIYFASDFHLKMNDPKSLDREKIIVQWLEESRSDMEALYLVGDVFDFWFDYKTVIPRGFSRLLAKLTELREQNIPIFFFTGNHDLWMFDYLTKEMGIPIYRNPIEIELQGKSIYIGHGDGLGPGDHGYKMLKKLFSNSWAQTAFRWLHPDLGIRLANYFSSKSREAQDAIQTFLGPEKEWLIQYCEELLNHNPKDYYIFGHRHLPIDHLLSNHTSHYINLGDWIHYRSFAKMNNGQLRLQFYDNAQAKIYS